MNTKQNNTVIIKSYMAITNADDDKVYEDMNNVIYHTKVEYNLIVTGYMNPRNKLILKNTYFKHHKRQLESSRRHRESINRL